MYIDDEEEKEKIDPEENNNKDIVEELDAIDEHPDDIENDEKLEELEKKLEAQEKAAEEAEEAEAEAEAEAEEAEEDEDGEEKEAPQEEKKIINESIYPDELNDERLEYIFIGLLLNNPKAISMYYFLLQDCHFANEDLYNIYRSIIFREGEQWIPAAGKEGYTFPTEDGRIYDLKQEIKRVVGAKNYNFDLVYTELKKLFIIKKNYMVAPTKKIREKLLEIQNYKLYKQMSVQEVENAIEQIGVTSGLTQSVLNDDATYYLLCGETSLSNGVSLPFRIITESFKGIRKGETMAYGMPSNCGKSRFTVDIAAYLAFVHHRKVLIISNEMSEEKMRLCLMTTIINNPIIQEQHGQKLHVSESELLDLKFRPDDPKKQKLDEDGYILREEGEDQETYVNRLEKLSEQYRQTVKVTDWVEEQHDSAVHFIHVTNYADEDLKKIIMNYYYKEDIEYIFYDTLKADVAHIGEGSGEAVKKTETMLSEIAQKFHVFIASSLQLLESSTLPVNLTINDMSASRTVKEVLDTLCLIKPINKLTLNRYEISDNEMYDKCQNIKVDKDPDVRYYACVVDKNRAGPKPTVLFELNLAYNRWEEQGYLKLKDQFNDLIDKPED